METQNFSLRAVSDPVVFELGIEGGHERREIILLVGCAPEAVKDLRVEVEPIQEVGLFRFAVEAAKIVALDSQQPVRVTIPVACRGGKEGQEAKAVIRIQVTVYGSEPRRIAVGLVAGVNRVLTAAEVLREEYEALRPRWRVELAADSMVSDPRANEKERLAALRRIIHRRSSEDVDTDGLAGLCLAGDGVRGAIFGLGVMQGLAKIGLLSRFDYLSSVSGGSFIASWFVALTHRAGSSDQTAQRIPSDLGGESQEEEAVRFLRHHRNVLTQKGNFLASLVDFAFDLFVLLPILAAALVVPLLTISKPIWMQELIPSPKSLWWIAICLHGVALFFMNSLRVSAHPVHKSLERILPRPLRLKLALHLTLLATSLIILSVSFFSSRHPGHVLYTPDVLLCCLMWSIVVPMVALVAGVLAQRWPFGRQLSFLWVDLVALLCRGVVEMAIYTLALKGWLPWIVSAPHSLYEILGPGLVLGPMLIGNAVFVAVTGLAEGGRYPTEVATVSRELWLRWSKWIAVAILLWSSASILAFYAPSIFWTLLKKCALLMAAVGFGGVMLWLCRPGAGQKERAAIGLLGRRLLLVVVPPFFWGTFLAFISICAQSYLRAFPASWSGYAFYYYYPRELRELSLYTFFLLIVILSLLGFGIALGRLASGSRFSVQMMLRERVARAYLAASHRLRGLNSSTGPTDPLYLHDLQRNRPLLLTQMAMEVMDVGELSWNERRLENFTASPLHCGSAGLGYRRTQVYGGEQGLSLERTTAIAGVDAEPYQPPVFRFALAILSVGIGRWMGNPGPCGRRSSRYNGPRNRVTLLLRHAFGTAGEQTPYIKLSSGARLDPLGLTEMIRRRCRVIVVCDAGYDPNYTYEALVIALQRTQVETGVPIDLKEQMPSFTNANSAPRYCALGLIRYSAVDGPGARDGTLIFFKPMLCGSEPYEIVTYARSYPEFPQEKIESWSSEAQFESYRRLGREAVLTVAKGSAIQPGESLRLSSFVHSAMTHVALHSVPLTKGDRHPMTERSKPKVFISYSHQDEVWKDKLLRQLRVLELEGSSKSGMTEGSPQAMLGKPRSR
ncbi:MAG TPA: hypothetical protein VF173_18835 [Thermoanaerobaculia bacterium]|nr:hypothetical protein [Thermoanaerobaculia bacterium]